MSWTALIPLKTAATRKSRLSGCLSGEARIRLSETLLRHLVEVLGSCPDIGRIVLLSQTRPEKWPAMWHLDHGHGLNAEVTAAARELGGERLLVIHADLPAVSASDIAALIDAAQEGVAIAPDRHGAGTNAIALADGSAFQFAFGPGSFARHRERSAPPARIVDRPGLALDIDTPADLEAARLVEGLDQRIDLALSEGSAEI